MKKYKIAALLMIIHGGLMEIGRALSFIALIVLKTDKFNIEQYVFFKFPYYQDNVYMMIVMGVIYGMVRVIGAIGLLKNRMWGFTLSIINCIVTMLLMSFMLSMGIIDGILACSVLILMLLQYYEKVKLYNDKNGSNL